MTFITTRITISPDDTAISTATPIPAGEHIFSIEVRERPSRQLPILPFDVDALPKTTSPDHHRAVTALAHLATRGPVAVTRRILREFLSATTRPPSCPALVNTLTLSSEVFPYARGSPDVFT